MNTPSDFDRTLHQLHTAALQSVSPQTLARLRSARHASALAPRRGRAFAWLGATACTALLAMVAATQLMPPDHAAPAFSQTAAVALQSNQDNDAFASTSDVLDQNPDLYVWLGSDASPTQE